MSKKLSEMTLEELWQLFPIQLKPHNDNWKRVFEEEYDSLLSKLPPNIIIEHIGSTAVHNIFAKPIVDILVETEINCFNNIHNILLENGYLCMCQNANSRDFNKGYTEAGFADKVFHLHLRAYGDNAELYFRDYLNDFPKVAYDYEQLKLSLWKKYEHDRDAYTASKGDFIKKYTSIAIELYGPRYVRSANL